MRFTLKDTGFASYKPIYRGRKQCGRVYRKAEGGFGAVIDGEPHVSAATEVAAFDLAVARSLGFENARALGIRNAEIRAANRATKARVNAALNAAIGGDFDAVMKLLKD